jgi:hypothetical protein
MSKQRRTADDFVRDSGKRRALSHETLRRLRVFLLAGVGTGQAVRPRFPRHAPACSGVSPSLVLRSMSPRVLRCSLAFIPGLPRPLARRAGINPLAKFLSNKDVLEGQSFWLALFARVVERM